MSESNSTLRVERKRQLEVVLDLLNRERAWHETTIKNSPERRHSELVLRDLNGFVEWLDPEEANFGRNGLDAVPKDFRPESGPPGVNHMEKNKIEHPRIGHL